MSISIIPFPPSHATTPPTSTTVCIDAITSSCSPSQTSCGGDSRGSCCAPTDCCDGCGACDNGHGFGVVAPGSYGCFCCCSSSSNNGCANTSSFHHSCSISSFLSQKATRASSTFAPFPQSDTFSNKAKIFPPLYAVCWLPRISISSIGSCFASFAGGRS